MFQHKNCETGRWELVAAIAQATRRGDTIHVTQGEAIWVSARSETARIRASLNYPLTFEPSWQPSDLASAEYPDLPLSPDGRPDYKGRLEVRRALLMLSAIDLQLAWLELPLSASREEALRLRDEGPEKDLPENMWEDYLHRVPRLLTSLPPVVLNQLYPVATPLPVGSLKTSVEFVAGVEFVASAPEGTPPPPVLPAWVDKVEVPVSVVVSEPEPDEVDEHDQHAVQFADCDQCGAPGRPLPSIINDLQLVTQTLELVLDELHNQKRRVRDLVVEVYEDGENKAQDMKSILDAIDHVQTAWQHSLRARQAAKDVAS